jgi:DNA-binding MarR family transcriptional regulator
VDLSDPIHCTSFRTKQFARLLARQYDAQLAHAGIKTTQYTLLTHILRRGPMSTGVLAQRMGLSASTLTRNLAPLVSSHWVEQSAGKDARTRLVSITEAGKNKQAEAHVHWCTAQQTMQHILGTQATQALLTVIAECTEKINKHNPEQLNTP